MGCGCSGGNVNGKTKQVWRVIYPDGTRSADFTLRTDAETENSRRSNTGVIVNAYKPA